MHFTRRSEPLRMETPFMQKPTCLRSRSVDTRNILKVKKRTTEAIGAWKKYSDFYIPDENGIKRKGIKTIEIVVD